jgi:phytanoyl-CoA dioxygenase PhyH
MDAPARRWYGVPVAERLTVADDLIAENEPLDALETLTELNRKHPDPDIEERLVLLRRDAFSALEQSDGRASWPPEFEDPFEGIDGLIEIKAPDLSLEVLGGAVRHHGHLLVRGLLPQAMVDRLVDAIDRAFAAQDAHKQGAPASETTPWFVPIPSHPRYPTAPGGIEHTMPNRVLVVDSPRALFEIAEVFGEIGVDRLVGDYLGDRPVMAENKWALWRMDSQQGSFIPWHQEISVLDRGPLRTLNVWLTLSACGENAPGFQFLPQRMDSVIEPDVSFGFRSETLAGVADMSKIVSPIYEPGDAIFFDEYLVHQTQARPDMPELRRFIESWMFAPAGHPLREQLGPLVL